MSFMLLKFTWSLVNKKFEEEKKAKIKGKRVYILISQNGNIEVVDNIWLSFLRSPVFQYAQDFITWWHSVVKRLDSGVRLHGFKYWLFHLCCVAFGHSI